MIRPPRFTFRTGGQRLLQMRTPQTTKETSSTKGKLRSIAAGKLGLTLFVGLALAVTIFKRFNEVNIRFFEHLKG